MDYVYTPSVCLNCSSDVFIDYLFCQPACGCYLFGDYYAQNDLQAGCYPCFAYHMSKFGYDPCFAYCSWQHHGDPNWHNTLLADYKARVANPAVRPPQTYAGLLALTKSAGNKAPALALTLSKLAQQSKPSSLHFTNLTAPQRQQIGRTIQNSRAIATKRLTLEKQSQVRPPAKVAQNTPNRTTTNPTNTGRTPQNNQPNPRPVTNNTRTPKNNQPQPRPVTNNTRTPTNKEPQPRPVTTNTRTPTNNPTPPRPVTNNTRTPTTRTPTTRTPAVRTPAVRTPAVRTPTVTQRRPVSTNTRPVTTQKATGEHPVQRLTNPQYSPRPTNQGRSQPAPKRK